jgi:two-component system, sensor histidine kinase and response regulator
MSLQTPPDRSGSGATILLVDDDYAILDSVSDLLRLSGYQVVTAMNGAAALPLLDKHLPDVVISDIMMPEMNGYELFDAVRSNPAWAAVPFIFLTAKGQHKDIMAGQRIGVDGYVTKPFEPADLLDAIETRLKRAHQLTSITETDLSRMKQEIITLFSHELRTPLTYIVGYVTLLEDHRSCDPESIDDLVVGVKRGADRLVSLVEDLMLMVRIDGGVVAAEISDKRRTTSLSVMINEVIEQYQEAAEQRRVTIYAQVHDELVVPCMAYYAKDALARLISNAIKFSKREGGDVVIRVKREGSYGVIYVEDNGIGIKPGQQRRLFERFRQLNRDVMEQQGIGLGLTIARSLVRMHGGDIEVMSEVGKGSIFTMRLPLYEDMVESALQAQGVAESILPSPVMSSES